MAGVRSSSSAPGQISSIRTKPALKRDSRDPTNSTFHLSPALDLIEKLKQNTNERPNYYPS